MEKSFDDGALHLQVLRVLLKLLEQSRENRTLAVAASDLGHFISAHPHGRNIVTGVHSSDMVLVLSPCASS